MTEQNAPPAPEEQPPEDAPPPPAPATAARGSSASRLAKVLLSLAIVSFVTALLVSAMLSAVILSPNPLSENKTLIIPRGASVAEISRILDEASAIANRVAFRIAARVLAGDNLQAGEYEIVAGQNIADAVIAMRDGLSVVRMLTIVEGITSASVAETLLAEPSLSGEIAEPPPEGSLLPETYRYSYGDSRSDILERAAKGHSDLLNKLWATRDSGLPINTPREAVIVASMIEKETGKKAEERPRIAGVFYNRLRRGMKLQSDPTVIYAITNGKTELERDLTHGDLAVPSPYNTYFVNGLPKDPICNPGRAALEAALKPDSNDYLYFVADGTGGHAFAATLAEHNKNVSRWRKISIGK